ncbi:hypothetical protein [Actinomadura parmotrematis]|uniref:C2H2-type domain-containing protein n=1 Tax=Actinomadura parmotrematis TaxID=2864039 RepID=A0ABS7FNS2_9ACTN|nr:hypothetical protein [Actinomadura parmotrematis]MBW8481650.1 hypothetical protein [Actinomadura parmotrematis]
MRDAWSSHEVWVYECLCCAASWDEEFEVRHTADGHGGEGVVYEHAGHRCTVPWCDDHTCAACGSQNVKAFSAPWRRRATAPEARRDSGLEMLFRLRRLHAW